ncbi:MAG: hypothetical protein WBD46_06845 [Acidobacteriaceae bacterium]
MRREGNGEGGRTAIEADGRGEAQRVTGGWWRRFDGIRHVLGIDRAVGFTVMARGWNIGSGALTIVLIAHFLSPAEQGYYYTFASLVALQTVFELGFSFVILQLAAHESTRLKIAANGEVSGESAAHSRLASVLQKSVRWYSVAALLMGVGLVIAGVHFFAVHAQASSPVAWKLPWICVVVATIFTFQMDPVFSFLEGCGFVPQVARLRLAQAVTGSTLAWTALSTRHGLFAPAAIISGQAIAGAVFLFSKRKLLYPLLRRRPGVHIVGWREEIWPFQWRIAVSFLCSYFVFPLFSPVLFAYRGATEAGRMGMSLTIANALAALAYAWINTKASPFGSMIARRDYATLDRVFFRSLIQSGALLLGGEAAVLSLLFALKQYVPRLAMRMLPIPIFGLLMFTIFLNHVVNCEAAYLRAHKKEPFLILAILMASLTGASTVVTGRLWGSAGMVVGYFLCGGLFYVAGGTYIFVRKRREWHMGAPVIPVPGV